MIGNVELLLIVYLLQNMVFPLVTMQFEKLKYPKWIVFCLVYVMISADVLIFWKDWENGTELRGLVCLLTLLVTFWIVLDKSPREKVLYTLGYYLIALVADLTNCGFWLIALNGDMGLLLTTSNDPLRILLSAMYPVFHMTFASICMCFVNQIEKATRRRIIVTMLLLLASHCAFAFTLSRQLNLLAENVLGYACICVFLGVVVQYIMYTTINNSIAAVKDRMELEHLKEKQAMDLKYIQMAQERAGEMSAFRHDFKNQLQVAYALLEEDPERAAVFLKELEEKVEQIEVLPPKAEETN